ncbi:hypothetical protein Sango_2043700 [Sesamum angolense]|uniref:Uncharacterized protein n=1 Tax=Sesamum angolense TaxID=2727404 RepID=A0AAE2BP98_9LAMI|nr:hypothetical protein Sango_2043700 [Sesamum angolense]
MGMWSIQNSGRFESVQPTHAIFNGLHESFDHVRNQILLMEPLPSVNKAYSMVQRVEKQREVHSEVTNSIQNVAMQARENRRNTNFAPRFTQRKKIQAEKQNMFREECGKTGHLKSTCFEIHGFPEWYKALVEKKKGQASTSQALIPCKNSKAIQATREAGLYIMNVICILEEASGLKMKVSKLAIVFSRNTPQHVRVEVATVTLSSQIVVVGRNPIEDWDQSLVRIASSPWLPRPTTFQLVLPPRTLEVDAPVEDKPVRLIQSQSGQYLAQPSVGTRPCASTQAPRLGSYDVDMRPTSVADD